MNRETAIVLFHKLNRGAPNRAVTGRVLEAFAREVEASERERCADRVRAILEQVENLDEENPQPDLSCIDWLRTSIAAIVGPNV